MPDNKNLVYVSVFHSRTYIRLLEMLLDSMLHYTAFPFDILILTQADFREEIESLARARGMLLSIHVLEGVTGLLDAAAARLRVFEWTQITKYDTILYLDTDILINDDLTRVFRLPVEPGILYGLREGRVDHPYWGGDLFDFAGRDSGIARDRPAITTGILLFRRTDGIQQLFTEVRQMLADHLAAGGAVPEYLEQPFVILAATRRNCLNHEVLTPLAENNPVRVGDKPMYHFPGCSGHFQSKTDKMAHFARLQSAHHHGTHIQADMPDRREIEAEFDALRPVWERHLGVLESIVRAVGEPLEGNSVYYPRTLTRFPALHTKQLNLFWLGKQAERRICEIGFNAGHSALLMLLSRPPTQPTDLYVFDIGQHAYMRPCYEYLRRQFPHVNFTIVEGDSLKTLPEWLAGAEGAAVAGAVDLFHVDGGHTLECITGDMNSAFSTIRTGGTIIVDDTNMPHINACVDDWIQRGRVVEVEMMRTEGYPHRALRRLF